MEYHCIIDTRKPVYMTSSIPNDSCERQNTKNVTSIFTLGHRDCTWELDK